MCEEVGKGIGMEMDGGEEELFVEWKGIEVCRVGRGKGWKMGGGGNLWEGGELGLCGWEKRYYFGYKLEGVCGLSGVMDWYDV